MDAPDIQVQDDGDVLTFRTGRGDSLTELSWTVNDEDLEGLAARFDADAREAWGSHADGMFVIISLIEELVRTSPPGQRRIITREGSLYVEPES